jgi:alanine racemase
LTHLKLETGNNRQGILKKDIPRFMDIYKENPLIKLEGAATHFANIEDTLDTSYAEFQLANFDEMIGIIKSLGFEPRYKHCANSAATILFPHTYFNMVRSGIGTYGLWPSSETQISANHRNIDVELKPVLTWKTIITEIKEVPEGELIGYGGTYKANQDSKIALIPVGYRDGLNRKLSNAGHVLIHGKRAPIRGRVCMNITMVDVTHIPEASLEDEVVIIGRQGEEKVSAEQFAEWAGTINYDVVTGIREKIKRIIV